MWWICEALLGGLCSLLPSKFYPVLPALFHFSALAPFYLWIYGREVQIMTRVFNPSPVVHGRHGWNSLWQQPMLAKWDDPVCTFLFVVKGIPGTTKSWSTVSSQLSAYTHWLHVYKHLRLVMTLVPLCLASNMDLCVPEVWFWPWPRPLTLTLTLKQVTVRSKHNLWHLIFFLSVCEDWIAQTMLIIMVIKVWKNTPI